MFLFSSPPTTSGIVVISGSFDFDELSSDFPMTVAFIESVSLVSSGTLFLGGNENSFSYEDVLDPDVWSGNASISSTSLVASGLLNLVGNEFVSIGESILDSDVWPGNAEITSMGFPLTSSGENLFGLLAIDFRINEDIIDFGISPPTTSGIVLWTFGDNTSFVVPIVFNARLFPVFQGNIPEQDKRLFPVLPQFATFIP